MKKLLLMITVVFAFSIMAGSCRYGLAYLDCVSSCSSKSNFIYLSCNGTSTMCSLLADMYKDSCKKSCE